MTNLARRLRATTGALLVALILAAGASGAAGATPALAAAKDQPAPEASAGPQVFVSSLRTSTTPSLLISGGTVQAELTVRNLSEKKLDGTVEFWITTPWGSRVSALPAAEVKPLVAGETRTLTAHLEGPGQFVLYTAHAAFTPADAAGDATSNAMHTRSALFPVVPFFAIVSAVVLALLVLVVRSALRRREVAPLPATIPEGLVA